MVAQLTTGMGNFHPGNSSNTFYMLIFSPRVHKGIEHLLDTNHCHVVDQEGLEAFRETCFGHLAMGYEEFLDLEDEWHEFMYPVQAYPDKVKSVKLDKQPVLAGKLVGIKGQYWLFESGEVWNVRSHAGYRIRMEA